MTNRLCVFVGLFFRTGRRVITKGAFSLEESLESLKSLNSLESLDNGRILLYFPQSGGSLKSLDSRISKFSRISRKKDFSDKTPFPKDPFSKRPLFPKRPLFQKTPFPKDPFPNAIFPGIQPPAPANCSRSLGLGVFFSPPWVLLWARKTAIAESRETWCTQPPLWSSQFF